VLSITQPLKTKMTAIEENKLKLGIENVLRGFEQLPGLGDLPSPGHLLEPLNIEFGTPHNVRYNKRGGALPNQDLGFASNMISPRNLVSSQQTKKRKSQASSIYDSLNDRERAKLLQIFNQKPIGESNNKLLQSFILGQLNLLKSKQSDGDLVDDDAEGPTS